MWPDLRPAALALIRPAADLMGTAALAATLLTTVLHVVIAAVRIALPDWAAVSSAAVACFALLTLCYGFLWIARRADPVQVSSTRSPARTVNLAPLIHHSGVAVSVSIGVAVLAPLTGLQVPVSVVAFTTYLASLAIFSLRSRVSRS